MCDKRDIIHTHEITVHIPVDTKYYHVYCCRRKIWDSPEDVKEHKLEFEKDWWFVKDVLKNKTGIFVNCWRKGCYNKFIELPKLHEEIKDDLRKIKMKPPTPKNSCKHSFLEKDFF